MRTSIIGALALALVATTAAMPTGAGAATPEYVAIVQEIAVNKPANLVWQRIGGFCDIQKWLPGAKCEYTSGSGDLGTNRLIAGRINEIMVSKTDLSYTYAQPLAPNSYHGSVEVKPVTPATSKIVYTIFYDAAPLPDQAAKDASHTRLAGMFMGALKTMKTQAEAQ